MTAHPSTEQWLAYRAEQTSSAEREALADHLVDCAECRELVLALGGPDGSANDTLDFAAPALEEHEQAEIWRGVTEKLGWRAEPRSPSTAAPAPLPFVARPRPVRRFVPRASMLALAASLAAVIGLGIYTAELRRTVEQLRAPRANPRVIDLSLSPRRGPLEDPEAAPNRVEIPAGGATLILAADPATPLFSDHGVKITPSSGGSALISLRGLVRDAYGSFTIALPHNALPAGRYRLRLFGLERELETPIAEYDLEIVSPPLDPSEARGAP